MNVWRQTPQNVSHVVVNMRERDRLGNFALRWNDSVVDVVSDCLSSDFGWTVGVDQTPVACIGAVPVRPGVWAMYMFGTDRFGDVAKDLTRFVRRVMMPAMIAAGAHRAECAILDGHEAACRWSEFLGGEHEATLRGYGRGGEDYRLYVWRHEHVPA